MEIKQLLKLVETLESKSGEKITVEIMDEFSVIHNKLKIIGEYNSFYFAQLLHYFPFSEKNWKIYDKLDKNGKFGYLSKYLIKCASESEIPKVFIQDYLKSKDSWKFGKKYYRRTKEREEEAILKFKEGDIADSLHLIKHDGIFDSYRNNLYRKTENLILAILEKKRESTKLNKTYVG